MEETYWTFSYSPIVNEDNEVLGVFVATNDVTGQVVGERRLTTVHELGTMPRADLHSLKDAGQAALDVSDQSVDDSNAPSSPKPANSECADESEAFLRLCTLIAPSCRGSVSRTVLAADEGVPTLTVLIPHER